MSRYAHIPWTIGILVIAIGLGILHAPPALFGWLGGFVFCMTREETQREYQIIETRVPPLRSMLKPWEAFRFWQWNSHSKAETLWALGASGVLAILIHLVLN